MPGLPGFVAVIALIFLAAVSLAAYLLPTLIGWQRHVVDLGSVVAINLLLGWTLVGWAVALAMALRSSRPGAAVQVINNPQSPMPPVPPGPDVHCGRQPSAAPPLYPLPSPQPGPPADPDRGTKDDPG